MKISEQEEHELTHEQAKQALLTDVPTCKFHHIPFKVSEGPPSGVSSSTDLSRIQMIRVAWCPECARCCATGKNLEVFAEVKMPLPLEFITIDFKVDNAGAVTPEVIDDAKAKVKALVCNDLFKAVVYNGKA